MDERFARFNNAPKLPTMAEKLRAFFAQIEGDFEVFSNVSKKALTTKKMNFNQAFDAMESLAYGAGGVSNGMDVRRVAA